MAERTFYLIANPRAGRGRLKQLSAEIADWFGQNGCRVECGFTEKPRHAIELAETAVRSGMESILALGGDGTAYEAINGIMRAGSPNVCLGILPAGTGNDFMRQFGITTWRQTAEWALLDKSCAVDLIRVSTQDGEPPWYLHTIAGFGIIAEACYLRHHRFHFVGKYAYHIAVINCLMKMRTYPIRFSVNDGVEQIQWSPLFAVCNSCYTGNGMKLSPRSNARDGRFEYFHTDNLSAWEALNLFVSMPQEKHLDHPKIHWGTATSIRIDIQDIPYTMLDGEVYPNTPMQIEILPAALKLYMA